MNEATAQVPKLKRLGNLHHAAYRCRDAEQTRWFYEDVLGLPLAAAREFASHKTVPTHRYSVVYYLGGMTLFFFLVQLASGILLMLYYRPSAEVAFESVEFIMTRVPFGWLVRSMHSWSANGSWTPCCYTADHARKECMWNKPGEITGGAGVRVFPSTLTIDATSEFNAGTATVSGTAAEARCSPVGRTRPPRPRTPAAT